MPESALPNCVATWCLDVERSSGAPAPREDLPLPSTKTVRGWLSWKATQKALEKPFNAVSSPISLGPWLRAEGRARCEGQPAFQTVARIDREIHDLATETRCRYSAGENYPLAKVPRSRDWLDELNCAEVALLA